MVIIAVFPGQGSQTPGFLRPWLELDGVRETLDRFSEQAGIDLVVAGTDADADEIRDTKIAQPLIVAASLLSWEMLRSRTSAAVGGVAGHSVGEFAALAAAGVISPDEAIRIVGVRGRSMAEAAAAVPTGMSAVIGGESTAVLARLAELGLTPANHNGGGQIVAAGAEAALSELSAQPPSGARVIRLSVAGAFHTPFMASAVAAVRGAVDDLVPTDPQMPLWTNRDGSVVTSGHRALDLVVEQVAAPVRWDLCMESFASAGVTGIIELAPGGTLVGLAKRSLRGIPAVAITSPENLDAATTLLTGDPA